MRTYEFNIDTPLHYGMTGKFTSSSPNWMHQELPLNDYELFVVTKGTLYLSYNQTNYTIKTGSYLLLPPVEAPNNRRKGYQPSDCSFYWLHFSSPELSQAFEPLDEQSNNFNIHLHIPEQGIVPNLDKIIVIMKQLQDAVRSNYNWLTLNYMATVILSELHHQLNPQMGHSLADGNNKKQTYYDIIDYIKDHMNCSLKVSEVANHFGYNEKYLTHMFRQIAGLPLKQFMLTCKMDYANYLLADTNLTVQQISDEVGFFSARNFSQTYKKINGLTPSEYRNAFSKRVLNH